MPIKPPVKVDVNNLEFGNPEMIKDRKERQQHYVPQSAVLEESSEEDERSEEDSSSKEDESSEEDSSSEEDESSEE